MSTSWGCETKLMELVWKLREEADELEKAVDVLKTLGSGDFHLEEIKYAKNWAKEWMKG